MNIYFPVNGKLKAFDPYPGFPGPISHHCDGRYLAFIPQGATSHIRVFDLQQEKYIASFLAFDSKLMGNYSLIVDDSKIHVISLSFSPHYKMFSIQGQLLNSRIVGSLGTQLQVSPKHITPPKTPNYHVNKNAPFTFHLDFTFTYPQTSMDILWNIIVDKFKPYNFNISTKTPNRTPNQTNRVLIFNNAEIDLHPNSNEGGAAVIGGMFDGQSEFVQKQCYVQLNLSNSVGIHARQIMHELCHNARCGHVTDSNSVMFENTKEGSNFYIDPDTHNILNIF